MGEMRWRVTDEELGLAVALIEAGNMAESSPDGVLCGIVLDYRDARAELTSLRAKLADYERMVEAAEKVVEAAKAVVEERRWMDLRDLAAAVDALRGREEGAT